MNSTVPISSALFFDPSVTVACLSSTSLIRSAETYAAGSIINTMTIIIKDMTT